MSVTAQPGLDPLDPTGEWAPWRAVEPSTFLTSPGLFWRGAWYQTSIYDAGCVVWHDTAVYVAAKNNTSITPGTNDAVWKSIVTFQGTPGTPGAGVPTGGNVGQVLVKTGTADLETGWADPPSTATLQATVTALSAQVTQLQSLQARVAALESIIANPLDL